MSLIDKAVSAVTPPESDKARAVVRAETRAAAKSGGWLSAVLEHQVQIESAFGQGKSLRDAASRLTGLKELATILTGYSIAEEAALHPVLAKADEKCHATMVYTEQSAANLQVGLLGVLPSTSQKFLDNLEHIKGAVAHHVY